MERTPSITRFLLVSLIHMLSVFLATSTLVVSSWILLHPLGLTRGDHTHTLCSSTPSDNEPHFIHVSNLYSCAEYLLAFHHFFTTVAAVCGAASLVQLALTTHRLSAGDQNLGGIWRSLHLGAGLIYILAFLAIHTFPPGTQGEWLAWRVPYLPGFMILLLTNIFLGGGLLILGSLLRRGVPKGEAPGLKYSSLLVQHHI